MRGPTPTGILYNLFGIWNLVLWKTGNLWTPTHTISKVLFGYKISGYLRILLLNLGLESGIFVKKLWDSKSCTKILLVSDPSVSDNIAMQEWLYIIYIVTDCFNKLFDCSIRESQTRCQSTSRIWRAWALPGCHCLKLIYLAFHMLQLF